MKFFVLIGYFSALLTSGFFFKRRKELTHRIDNLFLESTLQGETALLLITDCAGLIGVVWILAERPNWQLVLVLLGFLFSWSLISIPACLMLIREFLGPNITPYQPTRPVQKTKCSKDLDILTKESYEESVCAFSGFRKCHCRLGHFLFSLLVVRRRRAFPNY